MHRSGNEMSISTNKMKRSNNEMDRSSHGVNRSQAIAMMSGHLVSTFEQIT